MLPIFDYKFSRGPVKDSKLFDENITAGNCRLAIQLYFYKERFLWLAPEQILNPNAYHKTGKFIFKEEPIDFNRLQSGDVIYAQPIKDKHGEVINKNQGAFSNKDDWITVLHTAIYLGPNEPQIWHATYIEGCSCYWNLEKFLNYYKPVAVKRIIF